MRVSYDRWVISPRDTLGRECLDCWCELPCQESLGISDLSCLPARHFQMSQPSPSIPCLPSPVLLIACLFENQMLPLEKPMDFESVLVGKPSQIKKILHPALAAGVWEYGSGCSVSSLVALSAWNSPTAPQSVGPGRSALMDLETGLMGVQR